MPSPSLANPYAIELQAPDISAYAAGNTGVDYVTTFDSGRDGPHVMLAAIVHGNELCGPIALDWLLARDVRPQRGRLTLGFVNVAAYANWDPDDPFASRWVDEDFNRLWSEEVLRADRTSVELERVPNLVQLQAPDLWDLGFLGAGSPPEVPSWGNIMAEGRTYFQLSPWIIFYPGIALALTVLSVNILGDGLRDTLDPSIARKM